MGDLYNIGIFATKNQWFRVFGSYNNWCLIYRFIHDLWVNVFPINGSHSVILIFLLIKMIAHLIKMILTQSFPFLLIIFTVLEYQLLILNLNSLFQQQKYFVNNSVLYLFGALYRIYIHNFTE